MKIDDIKKIIRNMQVSNNFESQNQTSQITEMTQDMNLQEIIGEFDDCSFIDTNNFDLKMEDYNFVWENKEKLQSLGFSKEQIKESIKDNDVAKNITEFWENEQKERPSAEGINVDGTELSKSELKQKAKEIKNKKSVTMDEGALNNFSSAHGLKMTDEEKSLFLEKQQKDAPKEDVSGKAMGFNKNDPKGCLQIVTEQIEEYSQASKDSQNYDDKANKKLEEQNQKTQNIMNKTNSIKEKAKGKMQKALSKSQSLTAKSNSAASKVGLKTNDALSLKFKTNTGSEKTTKTENSKPEVVTAKETVSKENTFAQSTIVQERTPENAIINQTAATNSRNAEKQPTKELQNNIFKKSISMFGGINSNNKTHKNNEAETIGKEIQQKTVASISSTQTQFNKVEQTGEFVVEQTETQYDMINTSKTASEANKEHTHRCLGFNCGAGTYGKIAQGCFYTAIALSCTIWGGAFFAAMGIGFAVAGRTEGNKADSEYKKAREGYNTLQQYAQATQEEATQTQKSAESMEALADADISQAEKIDKYNTSREKQIDDLLKKQQEDKAE